MPPVLMSSIQGGLDPNPIAQANLADKYFFPTTGEVTGSYMEEAYQGVGSAVADYRAWQVKQEDATNFEPLTRELYENSPYFRPAVSYYEGMTSGGAKILAENSDEQEIRSKIIGKASGGQTALGFATAFGAGILEPKNVASGVAASMILSPVIGWAAPVGSSLRRVLAMKKIAGNYGAKAGIGAAEGFVGAAITEPFNRSSAKTLQQDYTMADTMLNIGLSSAFGAGLNVAPSFIKEKWDLHRTKTPDIIAAEQDTALTQLATGSKVDVSEVNRAALGDITTKPIPEQVKIAESFVKYTDTPEFKTRFEGSKVVDDSGLPLRVYHGTTADFKDFDTSLRKSKQNYGEGAYFAVNAKDAGMFAKRDGANVRPAYLGLKNPFIGTHEQVREKQASYGDIEPKEFAAALKREGYDGVGIKRFETDTLPDEYVAFSPDQIIPAFGERNLNDIIKEANTTSKTASQKYYHDSISKNNDTAIDQQAIAQLEEFEDALPTDIEKAAIEDYEKHIAEIDAMEAEGIATAREELFNALDSMNEADIEEAYKNLHLCLTRG